MGAGGRDAFPCFSWLFLSIETLPYQGKLHMTLLACLSVFIKTRESTTHKNMRELFPNIICCYSN